MTSLSQLATYFPIEFQLPTGVYKVIFIFVKSFHSDFGLVFLREKNREEGTRNSRSKGVFEKFIAALFRTFETWTVAFERF